MLHLKKLIILTLVISSGLILPAKSFAQMKTVTLPILLYDSLLRQAVDGRAASKALEVWKAELAACEKVSAAWETEVDRKENVLKNQISKNIDCYRAKDTMRSIISLKDEIIATQGNTIKRLGTKPKRFGVGLQLGYGYQLGQTVSRGVYIGAGVQWTLLKF